MSATDRRDNVDALGSEEEFADAIQKFLRNLELDTNVAAPGTVIAYDPATQTAQVAMGFLKVQTKDTPAGEVEIPFPPIVIPAAHVALLQGATHSDHVPIAPGDTGLLVFADRALETWYAQPQTPPVAVDPIDARAHDLADAIFIPGAAAPVAQRAAPALNPLARTIEAPVIALGAAAVSLPAVSTSPNALVLAQALHTYLVAAITAAVPIAGDGGVGFQTTLLAYLAANPFSQFATSKVVAE